MPYLRVIALALGAIAAGIGAGRAVVSNRVEARKRSYIDEAAGIARARIKADARTYIGNSFRVFARRTAAKAAILGGLLLAMSQLDQAASTKPFVAAFTLLGFLAWDIVVAFPTLKSLFASLRQAKFKPRQAVGEAVAVNVFDQVLAEAQKMSLSRAQNAALAVSGTSETQFKTEIAHAASEIAASTTWDDLRPFLINAALRVAAVLVLYSAYIWTVINVI